MRSAIWVALAMSCAKISFAQDIALSSPIDCALGEDQPCYIQNYVDADDGPAYGDFMCQKLSYDGHKGTDFALRYLSGIAEDVAVTAAAPGRIKGVRDGMADQLYTQDNAASLGGKDCGNGVVIDHGNGWETQYCHLKRGSVRVRSGDVVNQGDVLGAVGLSGKTQFAHVHMSVRKDEVPVDPFNPTGQQTCGVAATEDLWADDIVQYQPGGVIGAGFSAGIPQYETVKAGQAHTAALTLDSPALVLWGFAFGSRPGDVLRLEIQDGSGSTVFETDVDLTKAQAQVFRAGGRKTANATWFRRGAYSGTVALIRDGVVISDATTQVQITD